MTLKSTDQTSIELKDVLKHSGITENLLSVSEFTNELECVSCSKGTPEKSRTRTAEYCCAV